MKSPLPILLLALALAFLGRGQAHAGTIFSQTPTMLTGNTSDDQAPQWVADDFTLAGNETVRSVTWRGFYGPSDTPQAVDNFTIRFYDDNSGLPGNLLSGGIFNVGNAVNRTDTLMNVENSDLYSYSADLVAPIPLTGGITYWITIFNDTTGDADDNYLWAIGASSGNTALSFNREVSWIPVVEAEAYFSLNNENLEPVVPEPSSIAIFGIGALGLVAGGIRRRKRAAFLHGGAK